MARRTFSNEEIVKIKTLYSNGELIKNIAKRFNVNYNSIHRIVSRKTYRDVV